MLSCQRALQSAREQGGAVRLWEELLEEATEQWLGILRRRLAGNTLLYQAVCRSSGSWRSDGLRAASKESSVRAMTRAQRHLYGGLRILASTSKKTALWTVDGNAADGLSGASLHFMELVLSTRPAEEQAARRQAEKDCLAQEEAEAEELGPALEQLAPPKYKRGVLGGITVSSTGGVWLGPKTHVNISPTKAKLLRDISHMQEGESVPAWVRRVWTQDDGEDNFVGGRCKAWWTFEILPVGSHEWVRVPFTILTDNSPLRDPNELLAMMMEIERVGLARRTMTMDKAR
ncbi:hypothetical protein BDZ90DRAFT_106554 [Jaminaea rosea]|uniref:Uncharacterized protein n=1 Tax=Jaminaea rosea TaxID=1569628 RepID=A0A316UX45_9BASI|nr:hypothetical protein BDZ90DRAFT_106554 [Jaminaea rosea]PWN29358.1 hypothetical protein BDZ90DRAFT_106554 [Jaminaea rosea]